MPYGLSSKWRVESSSVRPLFYHNPLQKSSPVGIEKDPRLQPEVFSRKDTVYENRKRIAWFIRRVRVPSG